MPKIEVVVDRDLKILKAELPEEIEQAIKLELEFPNPAKEAAEREELWGWEDMPDKIVLWGEDALVLTMPRGFAQRLYTGLVHNGFEVQWADIRADRERADEFIGMERVIFGDDRQYQRIAVDAILRMEQGIWKAPPGAGKTVGVLEAIRQSKQHALVIVDKTNIAYQWIERAERFLNYTPGLVGDGAHNIKAITIAMQQTLWTQREMLEGTGFFGLFGFVCLDECHHLPAHTFMDTVQRFGAKYRIGVSGTPDLQGMMPIMAASLGEVFHTTGKAELRASGILVTPSVQIVPTGFQRSFWPTHKPKIIYRCTNGHESDEIGNGVCECDAPMVEDRRVCKWRQAGCQGTGKIHRNNYHKVIDAVIKDPDRNGLIAELITDRVQLGGCVLVLSSRLEHLAVLRDLSIYLGVPDADAIMFTGEQTGEERMGIARRADDGYCALFSTIADEALDIPRLDTLVLAYPGRNLEKYKQKIGRIERDHPKKLSPLVIDFDDDVNVFGGQLRDRRQLYASEGLNVQVLEGTGV